jgi:ADP-ribose pyrophosphatase
MQKPVVHKTEIVHQNPWSLVRHHSLTWPNGKPGDYYVLELPDACCIIAIQNNQLMTVTQYRLPIDKISTEMPMGRIEKNETPEQGAARELEEETGLKPKNLKKIGLIHPANGAIKLNMHVFLCTEFEKSVQKLDDGEQGLEGHWMPLSEWNEKIKTNQIQDSDSLSAWALYLLQKEGA